MKISKINVLTNNNKVFRQTHKASSPINFKSSTDSYVKSTTNSPKESKEFASIAGKGFLHDQIVRTVLLDEKGNYDKELEKTFVDTVKQVKDSIVLDDKDNFPMAQLVNSARSAFVAAKTKNGTISDKDYLMTLTQIAFSASMMGSNRIDEIFEQTKNDNGEVNAPLAYAIMQYSVNRPDSIPIQKQIKEIDRYIVNDQGQASLLVLKNLSALFTLAQTENIFDTDTIFSTICDENKNVEEDKLLFYAESLQELRKIAAGDYNVDASARFSEDSMQMMFDIIEGLIKSNIDKHGKFDIEKAVKAFYDWKDYVSQNREKLDKETKIDIKVQDGNGYSEKKVTLQELLSYDMPEDNKIYYNSDLYRMHSLFV